MPFSLRTLQTLLALLALTHCTLSKPTDPNCNPNLNINPPPVCQPIVPSHLIELKQTTRVGLSHLIGNMTTMESAKNHPVYLNLTNAERGFNASFNPVVHTDDFYALGQAGRYLEQCVYPIVSNVTSSELQREMDGSVNHYAAPMHSARGIIAGLVANLNILGRSDNRLSEGNTCIIREVECLIPEYPELKSDGSPFSEEETRLRVLANTATSLLNYSRDLDNSRYWTEDSSLQG